MSDNFNGSSSSNNPVSKSYDIPQTKLEEMNKMFMELQEAGEGIEQAQAMKLSLHSPQIRYRAKSFDEENKHIKWHYGALTWNDVQPYPIGPTDPYKQRVFHILSKQENFSPDWGLLFPNYNHLVPPKCWETITRCINFLDDKNIFIYVGDILKQTCTFNNTNDTKGITCIRYFLVMENGLFLREEDMTYQSILNLSVNFEERHIKDVEVIGNIFDGVIPSEYNPQLNVFLKHVKDYRENGILNSYNQPPFVSPVTGITSETQKFAQEIEKPEEITEEDY